MDFIPVSSKALYQSRLVAGHASYGTRHGLLLIGYRT